MNDIKERLFSLADTSYRDFNAKLIPTIDKSTVIGVRMPELKAIASELYRAKEAEDFLRGLPHKYFEENNLHALLIAKIKDFEKCVSELEKFLPYIDNWATCDTLRPMCFKSNTDKLFPYVEKWLSSNKTYTVRFAIGMLLSYYLDENFDKKHLDMAASVLSDEYYINMMVAWYFATALAKQYNSAIPFIEEKRLPHWVHNKTIRKAIESYRITNATKDYLRKLKI